MGRDADFTAYVTERQAALRRLAYLVCGDWHRADDILQAALTTLYVQWRRVSRMENVDAYVRTMVIRTFLGEERKGWRSRVRLTGEVPEDAGPGRDPAAALDVRKALAAVPPKQRAALVLRYFCDLTHEQAAEVLGCSPGTVKSQTSRGLAALRRALEPAAMTEEA